MARLLRCSILCALLLSASQGKPESFAVRGYYITFMRMPVMGAQEWKEAVDCFADDGVNLLVLWTAGGFRSKKFPITWKYNEEHQNVRKDFLREVIDYAHGKKIRVLLGFTPFGYDGVNRYPIEHPELKARKKDGSPVDEFGIHCRGWNLCAAKDESQRFMREYISEMLFEFYPTADGLLVESSDYGICNCPDCGAHYYDREFAFVRWLSDEVWKRNTNALVLVYPHYFTGKKVPGLDAVAAKQPFDPRWGLSFSPHSAHFDADLIAKAKTSLYWSDAPVLGTPQSVGNAARTARQHIVSGFVPSMEAFSYVAQGPDGGEPWLIGKRMKPFGQDALAEGKMPYRSLIARVQRFAVREFSADPELKFDEFKQRLGKHMFGNDSTPRSVDDLLELQRIWTHESDWYWSSPLLDPEFFRQRAKRLKWPTERLTAYDANLAILKKLADRYAKAANPVEQEMARLAATVVERWGTSTPTQVAEMSTASNSFSFALSPPSAPTALLPDSPFGINTAFNPAVPDLEARLKAMQQAGIKWGRQDFTWRRIEKTKREYDWSGYDALVAKCHQHGLLIFGNLTYNPQFYDMKTAEGVEAYAAFARAAVKRYSGTIDYWQIWNEPNLGFLGGDVEHYAKLLSAAGKAIHDTNPNAKVLAMNMAFCDVLWTSNIMQRVPYDAFDIVCFHPYRNPNAPEDKFDWWVLDQYVKRFHPNLTTNYPLVRMSFLEQTDELIKAMRQFGAPKPLWVTEICFNTHIHPYGVPELREADLLVRFYVQAIASQKIEKVFWWTLKDGGAQQFDAAEMVGLMRADLTPKYAYQAYAVLTRLLEGKKWVRNDAFGPDVFACVFRDESKGEDTIVAWANKSYAYARINNTEHGLTQYDVFGTKRVVTYNKQRTGANPFPFGESPVYIVGPKGLKVNLRPDPGW